VQRDAAGKVHHFHTHPVDEILVIIKGALKFDWEGGTRIVGPGDSIKLPAGKLHQSEALEGGAIYAVATPTCRRISRQLKREMRACQDNGRSGKGNASAARRSTNSMTSNRCDGASLMKAFNSRTLSMVWLDGAPSVLCSSATNVGFFISHL